MARIESVRRTPFSGRVYNLSVENDPTYYAEGVLVHNCRSTVVPIMVGETGWQYSELDPKAPDGIPRADGFCSCHGVEIYTASEFVRLYGFDPNQPREDNGRFAPDTGASGGGPNGPKGDSGSGEKSTKGRPGSQLPKATLDRLVELKCSKLPAASIPADRIKVYSLEGDDINKRALITWRDDNNHPQSGYTAQFHEDSAAEKFAKIKEFEPRLGEIRQQMIDKVASGEPGTKDHMASTAAATIAMTGLRPGNPESAAGNHFGIVMLEGRHVAIEGGQAKISFVGKAGEQNQTTVDHPELVKALSYYKEAAGDKGRLFDISVEKARKAAPSGLDLKDLRTLKATEEARKAIAAMKPPPPLAEKDSVAKKQIAGVVKAVSEHVSSFLCNSPGVARSEYIHPEVIRNWLEEVGDGRARSLAKS